MGPPTCPRFCPRRLPAWVMFPSEASLRCTVLYPGLQVLALLDTASSQLCPHNLAATPRSYVNTMTCSQCTPWVPPPGLGAP